MSVCNSAEVQGTDAATLYLTACSQLHEGSIAFQSSLKGRAAGLQAVACLVQLPAQPGSSLRIGLWEQLLHLAWAMSKGKTCACIPPSLCPDLCGQHEQCPQAQCSAALDCPSLKPAGPPGKLSVECIAGFQESPSLIF